MSPAFTDLCRCHNLVPVEICQQLMQKLLGCSLLTSLVTFFALACNYEFVAVLLTIQVSQGPKPSIHFDLQVLLANQVQ